MSATWADRPPEPATHHEWLEVVSCTVAGWRVGFEARWVRGATPAASQPDPDTGTDTAERLGLPANPAFVPMHGAQCLQLQLGERSQTLRVDGPVELLRLPVAHIHPLPALLAASTRVCGLRALVLTDAPGLLLLVDLAALAWRDG